MSKGGGKKERKEDRRGREKGRGKSRARNGKREKAATEKQVYLSLFLKGRIKYFSDHKIK